jgi:hypothetical protein
MIYRSILACVLCVVAFSPSARAEEQVETLEQLRQRYQQARDIVAKTEKPHLGSEGFPEKLKVWAEAYQKSQKSARALIPALLNHWMTLPDDSPEVPAVCKEIKTVCKDMAAPPSEQYNIAKSFLARAVWPLLADDKLTQERAAFLLELTEPQLRVRMNDRKARLGQPTEPLGWDVQAAYALALIRSGNDKQARDEITTLHHKVSINHKANPKGSLDYGPEAGEARYRNYIDYLQLCEILHGLQAAISEDHEDAREHIKQARKLRDLLSSEASLLIAEVGRRAEADED